MSDQPKDGVRRTLLRRLRALATSQHARHTALNSFVTYLGMGLSLLSAPILAQTLGADGRGVLAGAFVAIQLMSWVAFLGLPNGLALQIAKRDEISFWGVALTGLIGLIAAAGTFFLAPVLSNGDPRIELGIRAASILLAFTGVCNIGDQIALLSGRLYVYNAMRAATLVLPSIVIIVLFLAGHLTLPLAYLATVGGQSITVLIGCIVAVSALRRRNRAPIPWGFSLRIWISTVFDSVGGRGDQLALTMLAPVSVVGVYAIAVTCANAASGVSVGLAQASASRFVKAAAGGGSTPLKKLIVAAATLTLLAGSAILLVVTLFGVKIFGDDFAALPPIVAVLVIAAVAQDVWKLRAAHATAHERAGSLAVASCVGLVTMIAVIVMFEVLGALSGVTMALAFLAMCLMRLLAHFVLEAIASGRARTA